VASRILLSQAPFYLHTFEGSQSPAASTSFSAATPHLKEMPGSKLRAIKRSRTTLSQLVTPERFNRGASPEFAWIPPKNMRE
jgi:hypothetical protein